MLAGTALLAGLLITALAVRPDATLELLRHVWLEDLFLPLLVGAAGLTAAALILGVHSYRDRVGWGIFLVHVAWMLPTLARALVTPSSTSFSCCANPFTELTRLGTRSARRWYWFKTSDQLDLTCSSLVWIVL